ncbi:MAG: isoleucine--tRNA ligase [Planctomycetota bacterium]
MASRPYPEVPSQPRLRELEERVLAHWKEQGLFRASIERRAGAREFVFYDGPPFANGLPHYGHLLTGYVKDIVPRYQTMRGKKVERRFGWDCHGLPAEMESEKALGISGRAKIQEYGIAKFNAHCRASVTKYTHEWERFVTRQARWVDFANDYKTMDLSFMESVMWAFKQLYDKGLVYESYRVMPYSWAAETPVSNFETRLDNSYRERQDPAITVRFALEPLAGEPASVHLLAWTTTPWTLPSNLALAVGPEIEYAVLEHDGQRVILGAAALAKYEKEFAGFARVATLRGRELVGRRYRPMFPYFKDHPNAFRVLGGDFVDTAEGTGVVHMAPGFGEDDQALCAANGIEVVCPVDGQGKFTSEVSDWAGLNVLEANKPIIAALKQRGVLVRHDTIVHSYPHCWRTDQPLIYRALSSWYVKVTDFRERMVELNKTIRWIPEHVRDGQFGKWLEGARDWSISRNRFWGSPIPVWRSDDPQFPRIDVYGSLAELERDFGVKLTDLHRPTVDALTRPNPDDPSGKSTMRRVEDVLDCWFESGSMPFAQVHYPFENKQWFEQHFPADFIVEYVAQTRGWFYTLVVLSTALFDKVPFQNCMCHGVVLDEHGQKLSKRLKNYPDPDEVFNTHGADALRWYLVSSPILRGGDLEVDKDGKGIAEIVRLVIHPLWNAYSFFTLYANADGYKASFRPSGQSGVLDRYLLAKTRVLIERVGAAMDAYDLAGACAELRSFQEAVNNWYIRRSRPRFWKKEQDQEKRDAYDTLYTVLVTLCRVAAPFLPLVAEEIHRGLTGAQSVHIEDWPEARAYPEDAALVEEMDLVREVCSTALGLREEKRLRVRLPLPGLVVAGKNAERLGKAHYRELIEDEVNVKQVSCRATDAEIVKHQLVANFKRLGPRLGADMKKVAAALMAQRFEHVRDAQGNLVLTRIVVEGHELSETDGDFQQRLVPLGDDATKIVGVTPARLAVQLDTRLTPELEREGVARDLVRLIQGARKDAGFDVSDRIHLRVEGEPSVAAALEAHRDYVMQQTLALELALGPAENGWFSAEGEAGSSRARVAVKRA